MAEAGRFFSASAVLNTAAKLLRNVPYASVRRLSCECDDLGVLVLRGTLPSFYLKQLAQEAVAKIEGVSCIANETVVV
ncbi:MAG: BON domain-containing protein [Thermoguttaceae bacterium]